MTRNHLDGDRSVPALRRSNLFELLRVLRGERTIARAELASATGMSVQTVHRLVDDLQRLGLVLPAAVDEPGKPLRGRPTMHFRFAAESAFIAGIDVGGTTTRLALAHLDGQIRHFARVPTQEFGGSLTDGLFSALNELRARGDPIPLVGLGVGVPSVVDADGRLVKPWRMVEWAGEPLGESLTERVGCRVVVRQDNHLAAQAETSGGGTADGCRSAVVIELGSGIGAGAMVDGTMQIGSHGRFGRLMSWPCDMPAGLEQVGSTLGDCLTDRGLLEQVRRRPSARQFDDTSALFAAAAAGEADATATVDWAARTFNRVLLQIVLLLDPEVVVVGGGVGRALEASRHGAVSEGIAAPVRASVLGDEAVVDGGLLAAQEAVDGWLNGCISTAG